jgi:hypothetical protein
MDTKIQARTSAFEVRGFYLAIAFSTLYLNSNERTTCRRYSDGSL